MKDGLCQSGSNFCHLLLWLEEFGCKMVASYLGPSSGWGWRLPILCLNRGPCPWNQGAGCPWRGPLGAKPVQIARQIVGVVTQLRLPACHLVGLHVILDLCFLCGFPGGKESACNAGDPGSIPGLGRSPGEGHGNPLQYSCLENPMDRGAWWAAVHGGSQRVGHDRAANSFLCDSWPGS